MAFMKRQLNLFLLLLIIVGIVAVGGVTVFFQNSLADIGVRYVNATELHTTCAQNLSLTQKQLAETKQQLEANIGDVDKTVALFEDSQSALRQLENRLETSQQEVVDTKKLLQKANQDKRDLEAQIANRDEQIKALNSIIDDLEQEIDYLEEDLAACG